MFTDGSNGATNGLMWLRGEAGEHNFNSLNFLSSGMMPWMQQKLDSSLLGNNYNQQCQALLAAGLQNPGNGDLLRQQMLHLQQSGNHNPSLQLHPQPAIQQSVPSNILQPQAQLLSENLSQNLFQTSHNINNQVDHNQAHQQNNAFHDSRLIQSDQFHQRHHSNVPSSSYSKPDFLDSSMKFSSSVPQTQNVLGSLCPDGSGSDVLTLSRASQSMVTDQVSQQQSWTLKHPPVQVNAFGNLMSKAQYNEKDSASATPHCTLDKQNPTLFCNINSSGLVIPATVPGYTPSVDTDASTMQIGNSGFQGHPYACMQVSSELLHSSGQVDSQNQTQTFVKVQVIKIFKI